MFNNQLPSVLFTTQRKHRMFGYYSNKRYKASDGQHCDEIAINPDYIAHVSYIKLMQTIAHEMVHCWQFHYGKPSRLGYHNVEWGNKMRSIGLIPSNTGKPGGKTIGQQMDDYPDPNGKFLKVCLDFLNNKNYPIYWADVFCRPTSLDIDKLNNIKETQQITQNEIILELLPEIERVHDLNKECLINPRVNPTKLNKPLISKLKYTCPECKLNMWGKPGLEIVCKKCDLELIN